MFLLGFLLLAASAAFTGLVIAGNTGGGPDYTANVLGQHVATLNTLGVFAAGLALGLIFCLGLAMMPGAARARRRKAELTSARQEAARATAERDAVTARTGDEADRPAATGARHRHARHLFGH